MKVKELIAELSAYNPSADIDVVGITYGGSEGCSKQTCDFVSVNRDYDSDCEERRNA